MTRVFALFDRDDKLQNAQNALEQAGLTADVERVIDGQAPDAGTATPLVAGRAPPIAADGHHHGAGVAAVGAGLGRNWLSEFQVDDDEARFLADSVGSGASLLIVNTERPDDVMSIMNDTGGTRIFSKE